MSYLSRKQRNKLQHNVTGNGVFGNLLGSALGSLGSSFFPIKGINGKELGGSLGDLLPFRRGGVMPVKRRGGSVIPMFPMKRGGRKKAKKAKK